MNTVSKSALKDRMLEYFRNIENTGEELIVTDHGRSVLKIVPVKKKSTFKELFGKFQGKAKYFAPVTEPETEDWQELK